MRPRAITPSDRSAQSGHRGGARIELRGLTWRPVRRRTPVLPGLDLRIESGERVLVAGPSGAGKSTLLRAMAGLLTAAGDGDLSGSALVDGHPAGSRTGDVALLLQDPTAAIVAATVGRDVAFGLENLRVPREDMARRLRAVLADTGFVYDLSHPTHALSGGESQRLALAGGLVLDARALLLDEPTSMLDPPNAAAVRRAVLEEVRRRGCTLVVVEHRLEPWIDQVDRLVVLGRQGDVLAEGAPRTVLDRQGRALVEAGVWVPGAPNPRLPPIEASLVRPFREVAGELVTAYDVEVLLANRRPGGRLIRTVALEGADATVAAGRALALTGPSGVGKSTLLTVLAGLRRPTSGRVAAADDLATRAGTAPWRWSSRDLAARMSWAPQLPEVGMVATRVRDELVAAGRAVGRDAAWLDARADGLLEALDLTALADANPFHLSGGEQRRLMVAAALVHGPSVACFDEPTVGQDRFTWATVVAALQATRDSGTGVAIASHDLAAAATVADHVQTMSRPRRSVTP